MKKYFIYIITILVTFGVAYTIGYYIGNNLLEVKGSNSSIQKKVNTPAKVAHNDIKTLQESLTKEQHLSTKLKQELKKQKQYITQLEQQAANTASRHKEDVIPATDHERTAFVTNLVHQFNADNASTEIVDISCENNFCFLTANVSAGANTNPEIANLMKFMDAKKLPAYYQKVELLNVTKEDNHSAIKLALNME